MSFRYLCLNGNYRNKLNFTWEALKSAETALERLYEGVLAHRDSKDAEVEDNVIDSFLKEFEEAINDDLNIPLAIGVLWKVVRYPVKSYKLYELILKMDQIFSLDFANPKIKDAASEETLPAELMQLIEERQKARKEKNYALADKIRDELLAKGIALRDTKEGVKWERIMLQ